MAVRSRATNGKGWSGPVPEDFPGRGRTFVAWPDFFVAQRKDLAGEQTEVKRTPTKIAVHIGQGEHRRTLRCGLVGGTLDPQVIARLYSYEERRAGVAIELVNRGCPDFWHAVEEGEIDLAVTVRPPAVGTGVEAVRISRLDQSLVVHRANPVAMFGRKRGWVDFTHDMPGCTLLETEGRLDPYLDLLKSLGIQRKMVGEDRGFIRQLIAHDRGCVLTISGLVERYMCDEACVLPVRGIPPEMDLDPYLVFRPNPDEEIRGFANHALECLGSAAQLDS